MNDPPTTHPPRDGEPVRVLAEALGVCVPTVRNWCGWESHPALGRCLRRGLGPFVVTARDGQPLHLWGLLVSRTDVAACVTVLRSPLHRRIPGNPGVWIAPGIFRHDDGRLFFTERYVYANRVKFGMPECTLSRHFYRKRLEAIRVVWPRRQARGGGWTANAYSEASLDRLVERRDGRADGGRWLVPGEVWRDAEGLWYSLKHIARQVERPVEHVYGLLRRRPDRLMRLKRVPRANGGQPPFVYHESESWVRELLGIGGHPAADGNGSGPPAVAADQPSPRKPQKKRGRPKGKRSSGVVEREAEMLAAWERGEFTSKAAAGRAFAFHRSPTRPRSSTGTSASGGVGNYPARRRPR